jgi:hypothetical protein
MYLSKQLNTACHNSLYQPYAAVSAINIPQLVNPQKCAAQTYAGYTAWGSADLEFITSRYQVHSEAARRSLAATFVSSV